MGFKGGQGERHGYALWTDAVAPVKITTITAARSTLGGRTINRCLSFPAVELTLCERREGARTRSRPWRTAYRRSSASTTPSRGLSCSSYLTQFAFPGAWRAHDKTYRLVDGKVIAECAGRHACRRVTDGRITLLGESNSGERWGACGSSCPITSRSTRRARRAHPPRQPRIRRLVAEPRTLLTRDSSW